MKSFHKTKTQRKVDKDITDTEYWVFIYMCRTKRFPNTRTNYMLKYYKEKLTELLIKRKVENIFNE
jgi:hypothetical protein